ncbi:MAG: tyrosine--tRNA ligase [Candidatus Zixiibacteriota bacterium]
MKSVAEQMEIIRANTVEILPAGELEKKLEKSIKSGKPLIIKQGFDPTAPDIHLGHTVGMRKLKQFSDLGHHVVIIVGDYTARIGDPSGRSATRPQLSEEAIDANAKTYLDQFFRILDPAHVEVRHNGEWLAKMAFADILRLAGKITLARILEREDFTKRWKAEAPISVHELFYPLMQAYDSVAIKADVELGGTEQKFNLLTGRQIQEAYGVEPQVALTLPLLEGTDGVQKMSKSIGNYIGVTESPKEMFGKIMSIPDRLIIPYFRLVSDYQAAQIAEIEKKIAAGENPVYFKKELGRTIVRMYYDTEAGDHAQKEFESIIVKGNLPASSEIPTFKYKASEPKMPLYQIITSSGIGFSGSQVRRLAESGGLYVDKERVTNLFDLYSTAKPYILQTGKRHFYRLVKENTESEDDET